MEKKDDEKEDTKEAELKQGNISLILDSYDDIFSDFDPRHYPEKALSDDFLEECKRAVRDKKEDFKLELRLLVPKFKRSVIDEINIKKRLKNHFQKHFLEKEKERNSLRKNGILLFSIGAIMTFASTLIYPYKGMLSNFLLVLLEPAGWFTIWNGLDKFFFETKNKKSEIEFYRKMSKLEILFIEY